MIELTVKTLDSQNHSFTVEDDITVEQFKVKIADTVNIPAETQRIIYCGRVLQDSSKLSDYDVNGKVVHLVQRAPPSGPNRSNRSASPQPHRRMFRGLEHGNAMYLGSMAFPSNLMESQGIVPPPPTHSLAGSRLNVARRMLRRAESVIRLLENPTARPNETPNAEESQEEEVTPVIEARVIVPGNNTEPIDEAMVLSAVQSSLLHASASGALRVNEEEGEGSQSNPETASELSRFSTPEIARSQTSSTENLASEPRAESSSSNNGNTLADNASRTTEMAELLTMLGQLQIRFAPFLERYQNFMTEDPVVPAENVRQTQAMLSRVSEVLHFLGHAYHSLSDIIIRVRTPPPRPLLCRPILIQHSAVVQAGIPIQVEAQINVSTERPSTTAASSSAQSSFTTSTSPQATPSTAGAATSTTSATSGPTVTTQLPPTLVGFPFLPGAAMRVQSFPVEIRAMPRPANSAPQRPQNNNNNTVNSSENNAPNTPSSTAASAPAASEAGQNANDAFNFNNPNVEFFMEVTPEGITIDSLETTLVGSNQANDLLRGALNGPPPEFLQQLMQMAGQIINRTATTSAPTTTQTSSEASSQSSTQSNVNSQQQASGAGQNSQARGNTQTHPTTATHTRSTARPHVHLAQQAMQGGFDPFLPCNSHHVTPRRRIPTHTITPQNASSQNNNSRSESTDSNRSEQNIYNFLNGVINSFRNVYTRRNSEPSMHTTSAQSTTSSSATSTPTPNFAASGMPSFASFFQNASGTSPTLEQILQNFQEDAYVQGESIITDFIMLLVRNLTLADVFSLNSGNVDPIVRNSQQIRSFVLSRVVDGNLTPESLQRGTDRIMQEMQPFFQNFRTLQTRDDIDMVRSAERLFREKLPVIIEMTVSTPPNDAEYVRCLLVQCISTLKELCALTLRASANGQQGVEQVIEHIMNRFMQDVPRDIQTWTLMTSRVHLLQALSNLNVCNRLIESYIVRRSDPVDAATATPQPPELVGDNSENLNHTVAENMELDDQEASGSGNELGLPPLKLEDTESVPNIVIGSESWHGQVPEEWVPIIARDAQKQRRQNSQAPFSDAYLSGMPSKRRKIVNKTKPQGSLPQIISESVRHAVNATGLANVAPLETVAEAAGASSDIQTAYRALLRSSVQANLRENEDFTADRFPNATSYFNENGDHDDI